jgi:hypothetical protein
MSNHNVALEDDSAEPTPIMLNSFPHTAGDRDSERAPLLGYHLPASDDQNCGSSFSILATLKLSLYSMPAVILGLMLTLLDALSYGIIIFPSPTPENHIPG